LFPRTPHRGKRSRSLDKLMRFQSNIAAHMPLSKLLPALACLFAITSHAADLKEVEIKEIVDGAIGPLIQKNNIPGMAVAVTRNGQNYFYNYGVASKQTLQPVTAATLFEVGSISKTFTATLASYAQRDGRLALNDSASKHLPTLRGSSFDKVSLLNLGTHTAGGLPLQVPDEIGNETQLMDYFRHWQPPYPAGARRVYSNPSIGMLGMIAAGSLNESFEDAIEKKLFPALGMTHSYINVPAGQIGNYAQGYTRQDKPIRMQAGVLASEAYGVKSNTADLIRFVQANMQAFKLDEKWQRAIVDTHTGYFKAGELTQDLIWEQYAYPATLKRLLAGNADAMAYRATAATRLTPPLPPRNDVLINKTGSTNGFAGYVAFIPSKKIGIVILANKNYPIEARVRAAYRILTALDVE
jgi:CubicO group peptidase (beta-lactamase class C family)